MIQRKLGNFKDVLCASPNFLAQIKAELNQTSTTPITLSCDYIANHWQGKNPKHQLTHKQTGKTIEIEFTATRFSNSLPGVIAMAKAGAGLALIPDFIFSSLNKSGQLTPAFPELEGVTNPVYALHNYGKTPPLAVKFAIEELRSSFP